jgi:hypothetical protein
MIMEDASFFVLLLVAFALAFLFMICWALVIVDDEVHWQLGAQPPRQARETDDRPSQA